ncbi:MAG: TlpA disulfide reductase family protein [Leptothrix sp. (in: b-proteobacteria)]
MNIDRKGCSRRRFGAALAGLPLLAAVPALQAAPAAIGEKVRWPGITLLDGQSVSADALRDAATVVVFFSTTCPYCERHNQHIDKLARATRDQPLWVIGAARDHSVAPVRDYLTRHDYRFPVTLDHQPLHEALSPRKVIPLTCVIDRSGILRTVIPGEMSEDDVLELARWAKV